MRQPQDIERLYLDFDGFFASVMQQAFPALRGKPIGVIPFDLEAADTTCVIACSKEAKAAGCRNIMPVPQAREICPEIVLVTQRPDLYRRAHTALLAEINCEIPIDAVKSIDELTSRLNKHDSADPEGLGSRIKRRLRDNIGGYITCSIGFAANRLLAKIACKIDKPDGVTIWRPNAMPGPLLALSLSDVPGIGRRMEERLWAAGITTIEALYQTQPKHLRTLWGNVNGERLWYALHGYDIQAVSTGRGMYGHGRVLPPDWRTLDHARNCSRLLITKAARRMRRDGYYARALHLWCHIRPQSWDATTDLPSVNDDFAVLHALEKLWSRARSCLPRRTRIIRVGVTLSDLVSAGSRQLDLFLNDNGDRQKSERLTSAIDHLNRKFGRRVVTVGPWVPPPGGYAGGKISYTRIPSAEDFL
jgi:DNA polymerase-4